MPDNSVTTPPTTPAATTPAATTPADVELSLRIVEMLIPGMNHDNALAGLQAHHEAVGMLVGTILKQFGRRACEIKMGELKRFAKENRVSLFKQPDGSLRYEVIRVIKKGEQA